MQIPNLIEHPVILQDKLGERYNSSTFTSYEFIIDKYSLNVKIMAQQGNGQTLVFPVPDLEAFVKVTRKGLSQESSSLQETPSTDLPVQNTPTLSVHNGAGYFRASSPGNSV